MTGKGSQRESGCERCKFQTHSSTYQSIDCIDSLSVWIVRVLKLVLRITEYFSPLISRNAVMPKKVSLLQLTD